MIIAQFVVFGLICVRRVDFDSEDYPLCIATDLYVY